MSPNPSERPSAEQLLSSAEIVNLDVSKPDRAITSLRLRSPVHHLGRSKSINNNLSAIQFPGLAPISIPTENAVFPGSQLHTPKFSSMLQVSPRFSNKSKSSDVGGVCDNVTETTIESPLTISKVPRSAYKNVTSNISTGSFQFSSDDINQSF